MQHTENSPPQRILLAGASGGLGEALLEQLHSQYPEAELLTISRHDIGLLGATHQHCTAELEDPASIASVSGWLGERQLPNWVVVCCGILHWDSHGPEKNLRQCNDDSLMRSVTVNVLTHLHLAQALDPHLKRRSPLTWASLSAKVGSIEDNHLGGWYSYRMSKAALNMLVRNLSIEWGRKLEMCRVVAIHPGTTDTALSKPFQDNIPAEKLYTPEMSAKRIAAVLRGLQESDTGKLLFWDGKPIPW